MVKEEVERNAKGEVVGFEEGEEDEVEEGRERRGGVGW